MSVAISYEYQRTSGMFEIDLEQISLITDGFTWATADHARLAINWDMDGWAISKIEVLGTQIGSDERRPIFPIDKSESKTFDSTVAEIMEHWRFIIEDRYDEELRQLPQRLFA